MAELAMLRSRRLPGRWRRAWSWPIPTWQFRMQKSLRRGKVFVDWSQNDEHKTTVCVYSLRAKEHPTVSTPVTWKEVAEAKKKGDPAWLSFETKDVLKRIKKRGDLFEPVISLKQKLPRFSGPSTETVGAHLKSESRRNPRSD